MAMLNRNIKKARLQQNMTLDDVAKIVGVSKQTIQRYESGVIGNIPSDKIEKIAIALHTTPGALMGWDSDAPTNDGYYTDPEVAQLAEELRTNPEKRILFDASKDLSKDDIDIVLNLIHGLKAKEGKNEE
ncbi:MULTISPECIES: helix-turn-helix domain-containing protein [unclassified Megasphaera]|uniref:helix-turn-helix domain-containing protein n=1 Tax=unclassified Megasphaera TaxID=2626256 RepID=UPI0025BF4666|nr:helix-turn-helix transcriptional regulator [Megasphaera sp. UBA4233]